MTCPTPPPRPLRTTSRARSPFPTPMAACSSAPTWICTFAHWAAPAATPTWRRWSSSASKTVGRARWSMASPAPASRRSASASRAMATTRPSSPATPPRGCGVGGRGAHEPLPPPSRAAREFVQWASDKQRQPCAIDELWVSTKCGESDTTSGCGANPTVGNAFDKLYETGNTLLFGETSEITGGEHIVAERCRTPQVRERFMFMFNRYQDMINRHKTSDLSDSQPTKGNIAGGLTTIEEKALGNIQKIGKKCLVDGVLDK